MKVNNIKPFMKVICEDFKNNIEKIIVYVFFLILFIISVLSVLKIISINVLFWYLGIVSGVLSISVLWIFLNDFIKYIKKCWRISKGEE